MTHPRRTLLVAALALLPLGGLSTAARAQSDDAYGDGYGPGDAARIRYTENGATIIRVPGSEGASRSPAARNAPILAGDAIATGPDQRIEVELAGGSLVRLDRGTNMTFQALPRPYAEYRDNTVLALDRGAAQVDARIQAKEDVGEGCEVRVARLSSPGRPAEALLFLCRCAEGGWTFLGGEQVADYLDALDAPGGEETFWREFLSRGLSALGGGPLRLPGLVDGTPALSVVPRVCAGLGVPCAVEEMDRAPWIGLPGTFDGYFERLGRKERHELRRKMRRAAELLPGLEYRVTRTAEELSRDIPSFVDLHRKSHPGKERFMDDPMVSFFREVALGFQADGTLRLAFLSFDGGDAASVFQFRAGGSLMLYNSGYDPAHRAANPGLVLIARCIEDAVAEGVAEYDFLRGTERYKYDLDAAHPVRCQDWGLANTPPRAGETHPAAFQR